VLAWDRRFRLHWGFGLIILVQALVLGACGDCSDEIEAAKSFLDDPAHLACASEADCEVVHTGCHTFERGNCGQSNLSKSAAGSQLWRELSEELHGCEDDSCVQCLAQLPRSCSDGFCGGRP
jgi:hypothetical protein